MDIVLCGAYDLSPIADAFIDVVDAFGAQARYFKDASILGSNSRGWKESSIKTVKECDVIVYAIYEKYGSITWETEYETAKREGKQFLIFCLSSTWEYFLKIRNGDKKIYKQNIKSDQIYEVLDKLLESESNIIPFTNYRSFEEGLKFHLIQLFKEGIESLEANQKKLALNKLLTEKNFSKISEKIKQGNERQYLFEILEDAFEHKEIRKRIIEFFTINKELKDEDIISLMNDPEQGISRKVIESLPLLISDSNDIEQLFEASIEIANNSDDVGTDRRIIKSMLNIDAGKAMKHLKNLFPVTDIGTPKRILSFLEDQELKLNNDELVELEDLVYTCETFTKGTDTLKNLGISVRKKYGLKNSDKKKKKD